MQPSTNRIQSIDMMRGLCLLVMTLGHMRDHLARIGKIFFGSPSPLPINPVDAAHVGSIFFWLRCLSHIAVSPFLFLAGTGCYLWQRRRGPGHSLFRYLFLRGLMLATFNCVVFCYAPFSQGGSITLHVLWPMGISMVLLGSVARLPRPLLWCLSLGLIIGQNALETFSFQSPVAETLWLLGFKTGLLPLPWGAIVDAQWPVMPWFGVMLLGYLSGRLFLAERGKIRTLLMLGLASLALFAVLRATGLYGDAHPWQIYGDISKTASSFLNVTKYPPSFLFILYGLGCMCLIVAALEKYKLTNRMVLAIGTAPLFYYFAHILFLRTMKYAMLHTPLGFWVPLKGIVFSLGGFLVGGMLLAVILWPLCEIYTGAMKKRAKKRLPQAA